MDYEKAYNEARKRAKSAIKECGYNQGRIAMIESIFPELKKEGEDKRIIKILQNIVKGACSKYGIKWRGVETSEEDLLAWLEKQGARQEKADFYCDKDKLMHCLGSMVAYWADRHGCSIYEENDLMDYINLRMDGVIHLFNPNACLVDLSDCSEEYRKAYYDGWNNCNMQHSQCKSESEDEKIREEIIEHLRLEIEPECTLSEEELQAKVLYLPGEGSQGALLPLYR